MMIANVMLKSSILAFLTIRLTVTRIQFRMRLHVRSANHSWVFPCPELEFVDSRRGMELNVLKRTRKNFFQFCNLENPGTWKLLKR